MDRGEHTGLHLLGLHVPPAKIGYYELNSLFIFSSFLVLAQLNTSALQVCPQTLSRKTDELLSLRSHTAKKQLIKESKAEDFDKFTLVVVVLRKLVTSGETVTTPLFAKTPPPRAAALLN